MFSFFKKKQTEPLLLINLNGVEISRVSKLDIPCEKQPVAHIDSGSILEFIDSKGVNHRHSFEAISGWAHISIRVHPNLACQADCVVTATEQFDPQAYANGKATGIRFQPFFLSGAAVKNEELNGKGLFTRGLHYNGVVTAGNTLLSCECDHCKCSFMIRSFHAGFSQVGYFYSGSGKYTLTLSDRIPGCPAPLTTPNPTELAALEASLPLAPDGTRFKYLNPFRCPHCSNPYIDFEKFPNLRSEEYYGNVFIDSKTISFEAASS